MPKICIKCKKVRASYNLPNIKEDINQMSTLRTKWCAKCKPPRAINITRKMCIICNKVQANFNFPRESQGKWCFGCKPEEAINIRSTKRNKTQTTYNIPDEKYNEYSGSTLSTSSINQRLTSNTKDIDQISTFSISDVKWYKLDEIIDIKTIICIKCNKIKAFYNFSEDKKICFECKPENTVHFLTWEYPGFSKTESQWDPDIQNLEDSNLDFFPKRLKII
jgi:hypothetical protein